MFYRPHPRVSLDCGDIEVTKQSHKAECDIYNILGQYQRTGIVTHVTKMQPRFEDLPSDLDYQQALNTMIAAETVFEDLPASVRNHFGNDPAQFLGAFSDPAQETYLREHGFLNPATPAASGSQTSAETPISGDSKPA